MDVRKNDTVKVLSGKEKGKSKIPSLWQEASS